MKKLNEQGIAGGLFVVILVLIVGGAGYYSWRHDKKATLKNVNSFAKCVAAGNKIQESYPEVCVTEDGQSFPNPDQTAPSPPQ